MTIYRLKDTHPAMKAYNELCSKANKLGVQILFPYVQDKVWLSYKGKEYEIRDNDNNRAITEFPPYFKDKIIYEKED